MASEATYRTWALPGINRVAEPDSIVLLPEEHRSPPAAYNRMLDRVGGLGDLEALVLLHEDVEIVDVAFISKLRRRLSEPDVAVVGVVGARGVRSLAWWEGDCVRAVASPAPQRGRNELPTRAQEDVDVVDGFLMALSPWAVRELRFDEAFAEDLHGNEADFCLQARALGRRVVVDDLAVVHHATRAPRYGEQWVRSAESLEGKSGLTSVTDARAPSTAMASQAARHPTGAPNRTLNVTVSGRGSAGAHVDAEPADDALQASNIVWIFSSGRSGSTWLASMMAEMEDHHVWHEPTVGALFGNVYFGDPWIGEAHRNGPLFILGTQRETWLSLIRSFVLDTARAMFPHVGPTGTLVVRETYGSIGAPLLLEALPESRMVLLIRDPRDVVASSRDAFKPNHWGSNALGAESVPKYTTEEWSTLYVRNVGNAKRAYEAQAGRKALVRYEDLWVGSLSTLERIYSELDIAVDELQLTGAVEKHSWERIPDSAKGKGKGKFYRKGVPGGWKSDLTAEEVTTVERITASILDEYYLHAVTPWLGSHVQRS